MFTNPSPVEIADLLKRVHSIAVVGLSPNQNRPSYRVAQGLMQFGYEIIPVRPKVQEVLGRQAYGSVTELPFTPDLVDVFRAPDQVDAIVDECIARQVPALWLQEGVVNEGAAQRAREAGMFVVMDRCLWRDRAAMGS